MTGVPEPHRGLHPSEPDMGLQRAQHLTTNPGAPVYDDVHSLRVGPDGPVLLEDFQLLEKLQQFNRERIPERVVHAQARAP